MLIIQCFNVLKARVYFSTCTGTNIAISCFQELLYLLKRTFGSFSGHCHPSGLPFELVKRFIDYKFVIVFTLHVHASLSDVRKSPVLGILIVLNWPRYLKLRMFLSQQVKLLKYF